MDGGDGADTAFIEDDDTVVGVERAVTVQLRPVGAFIRIEGSATFVDRVRADLDMLRGSPRGQVLLAALEEHHRASRSRLAGVPLIDTVAEGVHSGSDNPGVDNAERVALGLPIDHDGNPRTPRQLDPRHPYDCTENGLRDEIGAPRLPRY